MSRLVKPTLSLSGAEYVASPAALEAVKELRILLAGKEYADADVKKN